MTYLGTSTKLQYLKTQIATFVGISEKLLLSEIGIAIYIFGNI